MAEKINPLLKAAKEMKSIQGRAPGVYIPETSDVLELIIENLKGNVTARGAGKALGLKHPGSVSQRIPHILSWGLRKGLIEIKWKK